MDYLIKKSDGTATSQGGTVSKIKLPEQSGGDVIFTGNKRPLDLGDYVLVEAVEITEPLDNTQKRGPTDVVVAGDTVTVTRTAVAKTAEDLLNDWLSKMAESDRTMITREMETHIENEHGGVTSDEFLQEKYNAKKLLRSAKPK